MFPVTIGPSGGNPLSSFWEIRIPIGRRKFMPICTLMEQYGMKQFSFNIQGTGEDTVMSISYPVTGDEHWIAFGLVIERLKVYAIM